MADLTQSPAPLRDLWSRLDKVLLTCAGIALALNAVLTSLLVPLLVRVMLP